MHDLWQFLQAQIHSNAFLSGGLVLGIIGGMIAWCRAVPAKMYRWCVHRMFYEFEIQMNDPAFQVFNKWMSKQPYSQKRARWLSLKTERPDDNDALPTIILSPAPGTHWLWWKHHLVIVRRVRDEQNGKEDGGFASLFKIERFEVSILTRNRAKIKELVEEAFESDRQVETVPQITVFLPQYDNWYARSKVRKRDIDSVILRAGLSEEIQKICKDFLSKEKWYFEHGIPYRLGMLWEGPPGNGKTSFATALAGYLNFDIAVLNLNTGSLNDETLINLMSNLPKNTLVLIEDLNRVFTNREAGEDKDNHVTLSGLLNAIDGVVAAEGRILLMTTNHKEELAAALIRKGRADYHFCFDVATAEQVERLYRRFIKDGSDCTDFINEFTGRPMVDIQNALIDAIKDKT